jgi:hypothetical protein
MRPDVVPSLHQQETAPTSIYRSNLQCTTTKLYPEGMFVGISVGTQTSFLDVPITSQSRPVIIQSLADAQISPLTSSRETVKVSADTQTIEATGFVSTEDKGTDFDIDISEVTNTVQTAESAQTDYIAQFSVGIQTDKLLTVTEMSQTDIPEQLKTHASFQTDPEETRLKTSVSTHTVSTETDLTKVTSLAMQTEELPEKTFMTPSNLESNSQIHKIPVGSTQPSQIKPHLPLSVSSNMPKLSGEEDNSSHLAAVVIEPDISLEEFTELPISVGTQTGCSTPFQQVMASPLRQFQFSVPTIFPPGSLLCRSSPMRTLLMPLGMICFSEMIVVQLMG